MARWMRPPVLAWKMKSQPNGLAFLLAE